MKRIFVALILMILAFGTNANAQTGRISNEKEILDSLTTIDPEIIRYFPRWKVCEPDLQAQVYQTFLFMGHPKNMLSEQDVQILAAPREADYLPFEILLITCGKVSMNSVQMEYYMGDKLVRFLSGEYIYYGPNRGYPAEPSKRDYCHTEIPIEVPPSSSEAEVIQNYLLPSNAKQAFTLSLFEQSVKIGETGFWIRSRIGTDQVGYHFWQAGEAKVVLQRPLYVNDDYETRQGIPFLINAYLGGGYRLTSGLGGNDVFSWVPERILNVSTGGKFIAGFDFHMPFDPSLGLSVNMELPMKGLERYTVKSSDYGYFTLPAEREVEFAEGNPDADLAKADPIDGRQIAKVAPVLRATGQISVFYHWWLDKGNPENYFRFDLGLNYNEVREMAAYDIEIATADVRHLAVAGINGLKTYKPKEFGDWMYAKVEYRNQAVYPFGLSAQYSNQMLLGRVWIPLFGNWFYLEGKYSAPLRGIHPFENEGFFMISPLLRLAI